MVFRVIDNSLTTVFNKTKSVSNGFNVASNSLNNFVNDFNRLNSQQNFGKSWDVFLSGANNLDTRLVTYFQDLAQQGASARANIQGVYAAIIDGNTRGYGNVKSLIASFNQIDPANQKAFAQAVGQTNSQLGTYLGNLNGAKASIQGYGLSLAGATAKTIGLKAASIALNTALTMGISLALSGAITLIKEYINKQKEEIEKARETANEFSNQETSLRNLREEYLKIVDSTESVSDKNKELIEWKKKLVQQYGFEEEALKKVNSERETGIALIDEEIRKSARKTIAELGDTFSEAQRYMESNWVGNIQHGISNSFSFDDNTLDKLKEFNIEYEKIYEIGGGGRKIKVFFGNDLKTSMQNLEDALTYYRQLKNPTDQQKDLIDQLQKNYDSLKEKYDEYADIYTKGLSAYSIELFYQYTDKNAINKVTEETFESWRNGLIAMAGDSGPLKDALTKLANETFPQYSSSTEDSAKSNNTVATSVTSLNEAFTKLKELLDDIIGYADTYQSAMQKISAGTGLTTDEVRKLIEIDPTLFDKFTQQKDGTWTIDLGEIKASYELKVVSDGKEAIAAEKKKWQEEYDNAISEIEALQAQRADRANNITGESAWQELNALDKRIEDANQKIKEAQDNLNGASFQEALLNYSDYDRIRDAFDIVKQEVKGYNDSISELDKAIETINEGNSLSYDSMTSLVEIYPQLQNKVVQTADGYTIEKSALENVRQQSYTTRNDYIDDQIAMTKVALEEVRARIQLYQAELASMTYASKAERDVVADKMWQDMELFDEIMGKIDFLNGLKSEYLGGTSSTTSTSSTTDALQNEIDYYNTIIDAIEAVADKKIEAIDKEIEGLEKQKDALEEANDERERELDLIEARNNLDKAKKQTIFVYEEGKGFVEKANEKAIADAQKEYDDIVNQIAIDDIDKQIEEQEAIKESFEDYKEQFTELSSNVEKIIAIEQAKFALGADEEGLLNLSDDQKQQITSGLAGAVLAKDIEDNKDNSKYKKLTLDDVLKRFGATVTADTMPESFKQAIGVNATDRMLSSIAGQDKTMTNVTYNNGSTQVSTVFNINGKLSVDDVAKAVNDEMKKVLQQFCNSVKQ